VPTSPSDLKNTQAELGLGSRLAAFTQNYDIIDLKINKMKKKTNFKIKYPRKKRIYTATAKRQKSKF